MLHYTAIDPPTLELLKQLLGLSVFERMRLVGGTSLALQLGHRKSIDIELFGVLKDDEFAVSNALKTFKKVNLLQKSKNISIYSIDGIKVDIVNYGYPWLSDIRLEDGIRLAQMDDIAAIKLSAVTGRGTKKDFIDIYYLLKQYSLKQLLDLYSKKYSDGSEFLVLKSLSYFSDADEDPDPNMLHNVRWDQIKVYFRKLLREYS